MDWVHYRMTVNRALNWNCLVKILFTPSWVKAIFCCCTAFALVVCCLVCLGGSGWVLRQGQEKKWPDSTVNSRILAVEFPHFSINALADLSGVVPAFSLVGSDSFLTIKIFLRGWSGTVIMGLVRREEGRGKRNVGKEKCVREMGGELHWMDLE